MKKEEAIDKAMEKMIKDAKAEISRIKEMNLSKLKENLKVAKSWFKNAGIASCHADAIVNLAFIITNVEMKAHQQMAQIDARVEQARRMKEMKEK